MGKHARRGRRSKLAALVALPVVGGGIAAVAPATPAGAAVTVTRQHTFTDFSNVQHTCSYQTVREYPYNGDNQVGRGATTAVASADPACTDGVIAFIGAHYFDPDGNEITTGHNADGVSTARRYAPVGSQFTTIHEVDYSANCMTNCVAHFERTK